MQHPEDKSSTVDAAVATFPWLAFRKRLIVPTLSETTMVRSAALAAEICCQTDSSMPARSPLISMLNGAWGNAAYSTSNVGILTPLSRQGNVRPSVVKR